MSQPPELDRLIRAAIWQPRRALLVLVLVVPAAVGVGARLLQGQWNQTAVATTVFVTIMCHLLGIIMAAVGPVVSHPLARALGTSALLALPTHSHGWVFFLSQGVLLELGGAFREVRYLSRTVYPAFKGLEVGREHVTLRIENVDGTRHSGPKVHVLEEKLRVDPAVLDALGERLREVGSVRYDGNQPAERHGTGFLVALGMSLLYAGLVAGGWLWVSS